MAARPSERWKLTPATIAKLPRPETGRAEYADETVHGLWVRIAASGRDVYVVRWGKAGRYTIGPVAAWPVEKARQRATQLLRAVEAGEDPQQEKVDRRVSPSLADLATRYVAARVSRGKLGPRTKAEYDRMIAKFLPAIAGAAAELQRGEVEAALDAIADTSGPAQANRVTQLVNAVLTWASAGGRFLRYNPCARLERRQEVARERYLTDAEIVALWTATSPTPPAEALARWAAEADKRWPAHRPTAAAAGYDPARKGEHLKYDSPRGPAPRWAAAFARLMVLLAPRPAELMLARRVDVDLSMNVWRIPPEHRKTRKPLVVPLSTTAAELFRELLESHDDPRVFARAGTNATRWWHPIRVRAMLEGAEHFTRHDLRRTCATGLARMGERPDIVSRVLGHSLPSGTLAVTAVYARFDRMPEVATALEAWAAHVERITGGHDR